MGSDLQRSFSQSRAQPATASQGELENESLELTVCPPSVFLPSLSPVSGRGTPLAAPSRVIVVSLGAGSRVELSTQRQWKIPRPLLLPREGQPAPWGGLMTYCGLVTICLFHGRKAETAPRAHLSYPVHHPNSPHIP